MQLSNYIVEPCVVVDEVLPFPTFKGVRTEKLIS